MKNLLVGLALVACSALGSLAAEPNDIVIADFEGADCGTWTATGNAFGKGPAQGTFNGQHTVDGFLGKGLVNTYLNGDGSTGVLASADFKIARKYINFLIGGGAYEGKTCMNLLVDGKVVRTATGSGSYESLAPASWEVGALSGNLARIEIVDDATGGWGHINVDQIEQGNAPKVDPPVELYNEKFRPQFHFTARTNWLNDPNGLVFYKGEYHLFFQHNPTGIDWGNMTWGHAVSPDLIHWQQLEHAIHPDQLGTIYSGSAVVDENNTAGFQTGREKTIACIYTSAGGPFSQSIAYSTDCGRTWTKYAGNPVLGHVADQNRDPKVFWHAPTRKWVMALYLTGDRYALFTSRNLKEWTRLSDIPPFGSGECPDMFEMPVDGDSKNTRWLFWGGNNSYLIGSFDGTTFTKENGPFRFEQGNNYYAAQSYSGIPAGDGRRIQIAWMSGGSYPRMPFNQQMSFPSTLTLRAFPEGLRLCREPVEEIEKLYGRQHKFKNLELKDGVNPLENISGELFDIRMTLEPGTAASVTVSLRGTPVVYDAKLGRLVFLGKTAELAPVDGKVKLQMLVDRSSIEVFGNDGRVSMSSCFLPPAANKSLSLSARGGTGRAVLLKVAELRSSWIER